MNSIAATRRQFQHRLFPNGIPPLWCPTLTHFQAAGVLNEARIQAHLRAIAPQVRGILVPGSTGEGWEMTDAEIETLLQTVLPAAPAAGIHVLIGILKTDTASVLNALQTLKPMLEHPAVVGVTICPPQGADRSQIEIRDALRTVLDRGHPTALYQLPQVTQNEMAPETVAELAAEYANFILFKDTSGSDRVALADVDLESVFLVRGAEIGGYFQWPKSAGGPYDGFLLSTANGFSRELAAILQHLRDGQHSEAEQLSRQLQQLVQSIFATVCGFAHGNAFTNANKLVDHFRAFGRAGFQTAPPLLLRGAQLPAEWIATAGSLLDQAGMLPEVGYWKPEESQNNHINGLTKP
ncbi:dihydrodipicolinate synthase family protein [Tuwongella immobilis]|uniref:Dihydrodipicolinate synthase family protein n=1 Tax=Tuwongella immobilis TaxID=692036 RepID=A0A6C2YM70_9BACT|nr:dihydrodipicolinate synthase family protein [Tuwongella immobilis]VIP02223.1 dihydrodipicolinate synthase : Dihydrodipicolinate synthetase OS=Planctomyces limnophilus (strain ATCC 43296 / DSM 3776 / IFAM 1008 / 290) GN=Plim_1676 PE=4 SV=1: DHDPS [Tuwongella immobilis]VTS00756.1 dihydrodipicolinate synthase : Dihydrodipicolinate synthetase OS=Planctomyces limnophilus (strain ATCC 43296 / DSM 3776 / IFAM 1008 / 290) GN=Plim_1676 PE=4 SV=1: DHDPS [Tuwongella immobilis]